MHMHNQKHGHAAILTWKHENIDLQAAACAGLLTASRVMGLGLTGKNGALHIRVHESHASVVGLWSRFSQHLLFGLGPFSLFSHLRNKILWL